MATERPSHVLIEEGRALYTEGKLKEALKKFTFAMGKCPCNKGSRRPRCTCKNFDRAASRGRSIFEEAMKKCRCGAGEKYEKCSDTHHITALSCRAATFEALQVLDRARRDAEWILELAPRRPEGYLRLAKIARLQKEPDFAWRLYSDGVEATLEEPLTPAITQLRVKRQNLVWRYGKRDPMTLPQEIIYLIISHLSTADLCRCLRLSRTWKYVLTSPAQQRVWYDLVISTPQGRRPPSPAVFRRLALYSERNARSLVSINSFSKPIGTETMHELRKELPGLKTLCLDLLDRKCLMAEDLNPPRWPNLTTLRLSGLNNNPTPKYRLRTMPVDATETVENLSLSRFLVPSIAGEPSSILMGMPRLKYLYLGGITETQNSTWIMEVSKLAPALEQLWLHDHQVGNLLDFTESQPEPAEQWWPCLKVFIYTGALFTPDVLSLMLSIVTAAQDGRNLEYVRVSLSRRIEEAAVHTSESLPLVYFEGHPVLDEMLPRQFQYHGLRTLQLQNLYLDPSKLATNLAESVRLGNLRSLDIVFRESEMTEPAGRSSRETLSQYTAWLTGCECITELGIYDFHLAFGDYPTLVEFIASLPQLVTLKVSSQQEHPGRQFSIMVDTLNATKLKTLYQTEVTGFYLDHLKAVGKKRGTEVVFGLPEQVWPVPLGQL